MTNFIAPGFQVGDRAFLQDGREGTVTASRFSDDGGFWEHLLDPVFEFFPEFDLSHAESVPPEPGSEPGREVVLPPPEEQVESVGFVSHEELRGLVLDIVRTSGVGGISREELDAAVDAAVERANLIAQGNLATFIETGDLLDADDARQLETRFEELESMVTTELFEIGKRDAAIEAESEEASGFGFFGFVGGLGGLVKDPVGWIMSRLSEHIVEEINDGLNR